LDLLKPSYANGYAKNASQSAHPELFDGLQLCWSASMGVTGEKLQTVIGSTDGTISGGSSSELWKRRKGLLCLDFDGVNDEALIGGSDRYRLGSIFTMSIWWRTDQATLSTLNPIISSAGYYQFGTGAFIFRPSSTTNIQFASYLLGGSNLQYLSTCPVPSIGYGWHHTVLFCDGNNLRVQHDGKQLSSSVAHTNPINDLESGLRLSDDHSNNKINGSIAETAFWSRELSVSERMKLWKLKPSAWLRRKQRVSVAVPAGIQFKPYWAKQSTQVSGLLK
jgi:hypothetical protein